MEVIEFNEKNLEMNCLETPNIPIGSDKYNNQLEVIQIDEKNSEMNCSETHNIPICSDKLNHKLDNRGEPPHIKSSEPLKKIDNPKANVISDIEKKTIINNKQVDMHSTNPYDRLENDCFRCYFNKQEHLYCSVNMKILQFKQNIKNLNIKKLTLSFMLFYITVYFFISTALLVGNTQTQENIEAHFKIPFHSLDFIGSFIFALVEAISLMMASMIVIGDLRYFLVIFNVGGTLVAMILFLFSPDYWEVGAHWVEYAVQVSLTLSDFIFLLSSFKDKKQFLYRYRYIESFVITLVLVAAIVKLFVFGGMITQNPEHDAHYLEFIIEMFNAIFAFMFTYWMFEDHNQKINSFMELKDYSNELSL